VGGAGLLCRSVSLACRVDGRFMLSIFIKFCCELRGMWVLHFGSVGFGGVESRPWKEGSGQGLQSEAGLTKVVEGKGVQLMLLFASFQIARSSCISRGGFFFFLGGRFFCGGFSGGPFGRSFCYETNR